MNAWVQIEGCTTLPPGPPTPPEPVVQQKTISLYYEAFVGQISFPLSAADLFGNNYLLEPTTALSVTRNGARLSPVDPTGGGGYTIDVSSNSVRLAWPAGDGEIVIVDLWWVAEPQPAPVLQNTIGEDVLAVTAPNTLAELTRVPDGRVFILFVVGQPFFAISPTPAFTYSGTEITWISSLYSLVPGDEVVALYTS